MQTPPLIYGKRVLSGWLRFQQGPVQRDAMPLCVTLQRLDGDAMPASVAYAVRVELALVYQDIYPVRATAQDATCFARS